MAAIIETRHDSVVCHNSVLVMPALEGFNQNGIGGEVVRQHNVVVSAAEADGEAANVICVKLYDGLNDDV